MAVSNYPAPRLPINNSQWRYTAVGGETSLSGYDNFGLPLQYTVNNELLYQNGVLLVRNVDYVASSGNTITGLTALAAGDTIEILTYSNFSLTTIPVGNIQGLVQNSQLQNPSITIGSTTVSFGTTLSTLTGLTIDGTNNSIHTNRGATNPATATAGDFFWNTTANALQVYNGSSWTSFAPPAAPTIGTATDIGTGRAFNNAAAIVTFTPNNTGGVASQYFVTSTPGSLTSYGSSSPITITGLTSSTQYTFTVTAQGSFGNSNASASTGLLTVTSVPQAPTIGTVTASGAIVSIPFTANATGGSAITSYTVTSSSGKTATGSSSPLSIAESTASSFTYTVTATNANGTSASSTASNSITTTLPTITGGTLTSDSTYYYRTFTGNGTLSVTNAALTADILTIAGGGGGGARAGGGGGAGGVVYTGSQPLSTNTYSVTVGGPGSGNSVQAGVPGTQGSNSSITGGSLSLTAAVGGGGGGAYAGPPTTGGSGGGGNDTEGSASWATGANGTTNQGNAGGTGTGSPNYSGGGGGGAGSPGSNYTSTNGGAGGAGTNSYATWLSAITSSMSGVSGWSAATSGGYIAGGGGGGTAYGSGNGAGGLGGGGTGANNSAVGLTTPPSNTGGGGGGGGYPTTTSSNGGSGIVIVRYTRAQVGG